MINNENLGGITHPNYTENNTPNIFRNIKPPSIFFIMMRINLKMAWFCLCGLVIFIMLSLWSRCGFTSPDWNKPSRMKTYDRISDHVADTQIVKEIDCYINNEYTVSCRKEGDEVYLPFTFLHRYFEVYGKLATYDDGVERFEWAHSYGTVYHPRGKYDARGVFMYFEKYNVEARERVKCISASEGVPVSRQWGNQGYYYPTQIAQFGLSHYSKNLTKPEPQRRIIEDAEKEVTNWLVPSGCSLNRTLEAGNYILKFNTMDNRDSVITLHLDHVMDFIMSLNLKLEKNSSIIVTLQDREKKEGFNLHYNTSDMFIYASDQDIYHGLGSETKWLRITRDLVVDLQKGLLFMNRLKRKISRSKLKVTGISLQGEGYIDNITFSSSEHISHFYDAADWFVKHQNPTTGGWSNPVRRKVAPGFDELEPGWYSAMGQGHAISVLMRAYHHSGGEIQYLQSAIAGLRPFRIPSYQGGVLATFLGKYGWYEEYPTHPPSFVLNGFIYSLLGLYDLMTIAPAAHAKEAALLFKQGMVALKGMLLLYDTGSGTSYDLRHFTLGVAPNLARWDYHTTHVNQLLLLSTLDDADILDVTAKRWLGYLKGKILLDVSGWKPHIISLNVPKITFNAG